jgi:hypothetical protein
MAEKFVTKDSLAIEVIPFDIVKSPLPNGFTNTSRAKYDYKRGIFLVSVFIWIMKDMMDNVKG